MLDVDLCSRLAFSRVGKSVICSRNWIDVRILSEIRQTVPLSVRSKQRFVQRFPSLKIGQNDRMKHQVLRHVETRDIDSFDVLRPPWLSSLRIEGTFTFVNFLIIGLHWRKGGDATVGNRRRSHLELHPRGATLLQCESCQIVESHREGFPRLIDTADGCCDRISPYLLRIGAITSMIPDIDTGISQGDAIYRYEMRL